MRPLMLLAVALDKVVEEVKQIRECMFEKESIRKRVDWVKMILDEMVKLNESETW